MIPGLRTRGGLTDRSSTVDSIPTWDCPPSTINGTCPSRSFRTCSAFVGDTSLDRLALGAASGNPQARINCWAKGWDGQRIATVGPPAVTIVGMASLRSRTNVSGPGQNALAAQVAVSGHAATERCAIARSATWTINGLDAGRPLIS